MTRYDERGIPTLGRAKWRWLRLHGGSADGTECRMSDAALRKHGPVVIHCPTHGFEPCPRDGFCDDATLSFYTDDPTAECWYERI